MSHPSTRTSHRAGFLAAVLLLILPLLGSAPAAAQGLTRQLEQRFGTVESLFSSEAAIDDEMLVTYASDLSSARSSVLPLTRLGARHQRLADRVALVTASPDRVTAVLDLLAGDPMVQSVEPNMRRSYNALPDDTSVAKQWAHQQTDIALAWDLFTGVAPSVAPLIAIIDSGVDATHPDLQGIVVQSLRAANGRIIPGTTNNDPCGIGHGTAVAGSASARGDNGLGVAGVLWASRIIDIALTSPENDCPRGPADSDTIVAMDHVTRMAEKPHAINLSLGGNASSCPTAYQVAADQARAAGIVVVAAAGNGRTTDTAIPASCDGVISVGATRADGGLASYSQRNPQVDIAAPGGDAVFSQCPTFDQLVTQMVITTSLTTSTSPLANCAPVTDPAGHRLQGISGTSFAAPYVAAGVALLRQLALERGTSLTPDQTEAIIETTATDVGIPGRDCEFGWGIIDLGAAARAVVDGVRPAAQPDDPIGQGSCSTPAGPFERVVAGDGETTDPVSQAVAVSSLLPDGSAPYAVLSRVDDFADALSGSALGFGIGPLLYTSSTGDLDPSTREELTRVLSFDGEQPRVFVMGGTTAIPAVVDDTLRAMGVRVVRVAGSGREATAVRASAEMEALKADVSFPTRDHAFLAYARDFPDAVAAGQMAARYGIPVLLTDRVGPLHPATRAELERLRPDQVIVLGGTAVIGDGVLSEVRAMGLDAVRLSGPTRVDTAVAVSERYIEELRADLEAGEPISRPTPLVVNLRPRFNEVLSASLLGGNGLVFMPLDGSRGEVLAESVRSSFCGIGGPTIVIGGRDVISDPAAGAAGAIAVGDGC